MNILAIGAHPGGIELGCGGTLKATSPYLKANAIEGLAGHRTLQSRMSTGVNYIGTFEIVRLCLDRQFRLVKVPQPIDLWNRG